MALDMSGGASREWFGFSPVVIVAAVVLLLGGSVAAARSGGDAYLEAITELCEQSNAQVKADFAARARRPLFPIDYSDGLYQSFERGIAFRVKGLQAVSSTGEYAAEHAQLLAGEQRSLAVASGYAREIEQTRTTRGVLENTRVLIATVKEQDNRYVALGVPKGCSD